SPQSSAGPSTSSKGSPPHVPGAEPPVPACPPVAGDPPAALPPVALAPLPSWPPLLGPVPPDDVPPAPNEPPAGAPPVLVAPPLAPASVPSTGGVPQAVRSSAPRARVVGRIFLSGCMPVPQPRPWDVMNE